MNFLHLSSYVKGFVSKRPFLARIWVRIGFKPFTVDHKANIKRRVYSRITPNDDFEEGIRQSQQIILDSVAIMDSAPSIEAIQAQQQQDHTHSMFDKFKASRATRKQAPSSSASPVISSLRGRKI